MINAFFAPRTQTKAATARKTIRATCASFLQVPKADLTDEQLFTFRSQLTIVPRLPTFIKNLKKGSPKGKTSASGFYAYGETVQEIWLPRFYNIQKICPKAQLDVRYNVNSGVPMCPSAAQGFAGKLHEQGQRQAYDAILKHFLIPASQDLANMPPTLRGGIVQLPCGFGKTVLSIAVAARLGVRTMVLVHTKDLMEQWKDRIEQFLPGATVGFVHQKTNCLETLTPSQSSSSSGKSPVRKRRKIANGAVASPPPLPDFAIGMIQSISNPNCTYDPASLDTVGFVIVDECHHIAANYFSTSLHKLKPNYILGLSATPNRKDGLQFLLHWYLGPMLYVCDEREFRDGAATKVISILYEGGAQKVCLTRTGDELRPIMINTLAREEARNELLVGLLVAIPPGRKVLVLSARVDQILFLHEETVKRLFKEKNVRKCGLYYGAVKKSERKRVAAECDFLFGTYNIASEGLDIPRLDTLVYATPSGDVKQAVGRILRIHPEKQTPLIVDIVDPFSFFETQASSRARFYHKQGYQIEEYMHPSGAPLGDDIISSGLKSATPVITAPI